MDVYVISDIDNQLIVCWLYYSSFYWWLGFVVFCSVFYILKKALLDKWISHFGLTLDYLYLVYLSSQFRLKLNKKEEEIAVVCTKKKGAQCLFINNKKLGLVFNLWSYLFVNFGLGTVFDRRKRHWVFAFYNTPFISLFILVNSLPCSEITVSWCSTVQFPFTGTLSDSCLPCNDLDLA